MCRCATLYNAAAPRGQPPAAAAATPYLYIFRFFFDNLAFSRVIIIIQ